MSDEIKVTVQYVAFIGKHKVEISGLIGGLVSMDVDRAEELAQKIVDAIREYREDNHEGQM